MAVTEYDIANILDEMELELVKSMAGHLTPQFKETSAQWQQRQLAEIRRFRRDNAKIINKYQAHVGELTKDVLKNQYMTSLKEWINVLSKKGSKKIRLKIMDFPVDDWNLTSIDDARLISLLDAVNADIGNKMYNLYRQDEDIYRQTIFNASVLANSGQYDLLAAIQRAQDEYLSKGLTYCQYKNGAKMPIRSYSEMAIRTNAMRAASAGRGTIMDFLGIHTVQISHHQSACPECGVWEGKVCVDDVYSSGTQAEADRLGLPTLSYIMLCGYKHPNCRHTETFYDIELDQGLYNRDRKYTEKDQERYDNEQKQRELEREIRKIRRQQAGTVGITPEEKKALKELEEHLKENPLLKRKKWREQPDTVRLV